MVHDGARMVHEWYKNGTQSEKMVQNGGIPVVHLSSIFLCHYVPLCTIMYHSCIIMYHYVPFMYHHAPFCVPFVYHPVPSCTIKFCSDIYISPGPEFCSLA